MSSTSWSLGSANSKGGSSGSGPMEGEPDPLLFVGHKQSRGEDLTGVPGHHSKHHRHRPWPTDSQEIHQHTYTEIPLSPIGNDSDDFGTANGSGQLVTMTGTIKRGKKGQLVEVQFQLDQNEVKKLKRASAVPPPQKGCCSCGLYSGFHVLLFTLLCIPVAFIASLVVSFYIGTLCWYNLFLYLSEERTIWHKVFLSPLLILFYPFLIVSSAVGLALYSAFVQVSWHFRSWLKELRDFEKGFFGWMCQRLGVAQCAPYEVVILNEDDTTGTEMQGQTAV